MDIYFEDDPIEHNQSVHESQIDPFPDEYTEYETSEYYEIFYEPRTSLQQDGAPVVSSNFVPKKVYFIEPENEAEITIKKNQTGTFNASVSYVSVSGDNLGFNISLKRCSTNLCSQERTYYQSITAQYQVLDPKS